jgi:hypothetical protein
MPPRNRARNIKLRKPGNAWLAEVLLGETGFGVPVRMQGYRLVGETNGRLARLYERNDHPGAKRRGRWDPFANSDPATGFFSGSFWGRFFYRCDELLTEGSTWTYVNTWYPKPGLRVVVYRKEEKGEYLHIPKRQIDGRFSLMIRSDLTRMRVTNTRAE